MDFLAILSPIFSKLIERLLPDQEKQNEAKIALQQALNEANAELYKAQAVQDAAKKDIIVAEIQSKSIASNWRAYLMLVCIGIVGYNWILVSFLNAFLHFAGVQIAAVPVPTELWTLVSIGLGGYIGKETISNYSQNKYQGASPQNDKVFFDILRKKIFKSGMTKEQVDALNQALEARDGE